MKIKLPGAAALISPVEAPPIPDVGALSLGFDAKMFVELAALPLPNIETLTEIGDHGIAMTTGEFNFR